MQVLTMLEGINEDIDYDCVKTLLCRMSEGACPRVEKKWVPVRHCKDRRGLKSEYLYRFNPRFERALSTRRGTQSHLAVIASIERSNPARLSQPPNKRHLAASLSLVPAYTSPIFSGAGVPVKETNVPCSPT